MRIAGSEAHELLAVVRQGALRLLVDEVVLICMRTWVGLPRLFFSWVAYAVIQ